MHTTSLKRVLFVDDSLEYLELIRRGMTQRTRGRWDLVLTHDTAEALALLDTQHVDLIVSDLSMTPIDGMQFLKLAHQRHPHIRKAMLTGVEEAEMCRPALLEVCDCYLLKPRTKAGFDTVFHTLNQLFMASGEGFRGLLRKVSLTDLVQLECLNRRSSILEMSAHNLRGAIYIKQGAITHAEAGSKTGKEAFIRLMQMPGGDFQLKAYAEPREQTIHVSWEQLLMEAAEMVDKATPDANGTSDTSWFINPSSKLVASSQIAAVPPLPAVPRHPRAAEVLVIGSGGNPLFQWQCSNAPDRTRLLQSLEQKCRTLCETLSMGTPALVDLQQTSGRVLAHFLPERHTFCRTEYGDVPQTPEASHA